MLFLGLSIASGMAGLVVPWLPQGALATEALGLIHGTAQGNKQTSVGSCTTLNVNALNGAVPPPVPAYVGWSQCVVAGTPCISCAPSNGYMIGAGVGTYDPNRAPAVVTCNPVAGGQQGICTLVGGNLMCNATVAYNCPTNGSKYFLQVSPP